MALVTPELRDCGLVGDPAAALTRVSTALSKGVGLASLSGETLVLALYAAVDEQAVAEAKAVLAAGADPNRVLQGRNSVLADCLQGLYETRSPGRKAALEAIAEALWKAGASPSVAACDGLQVSALMTASALGQEAWVRRFVAAGANPATVAISGGFSLRWLAAAHGRNGTLAFLDSLPGMPDPPDYLGQTSAAFRVDDAARIARLRATKAVTLERFPQVAASLGQP